LCHAVTGISWPPGVIDGRRDRLVTILVAPLMTCSARIPVYTLIISAFAPNQAVGPGLRRSQGLVMFALYAAGIISALCVSFIFRKLFTRHGGAEPFHSGNCPITNGRICAMC